MMVIRKERVEELNVFFAPYFPKGEAKHFITSFNNANKMNAWRAFNQTERLISLGEEIYRIKVSDPLRLLFLIICAEAVAKLCKNYKKSGESYKYVKMFFKEYCKADKDCLQGCILIDIKKGDKKEKVPLSYDEVIRFLYDVRCDVIHEGRYWDFVFHSAAVNFTIGMNKQQIYYPKITYDKLRNIVVKGALNAIKECLSNCNE